MATAVATGRVSAVQDVRPSALRTRRTGAHEQREKSHDAGDEGRRRHRDNDMPPSALTAGSVGHMLCPG
jgi:hypothetical protein